MKLKFNKISWFILFLWIIISGVAYSSSTCGNLEYSRCCAPNLQSSKIEPVISNCAYSSHCFSEFTIPSGQKDVCCGKKECSSDGAPVLNTQPPNFNTGVIYYTYTSHRHHDNKAFYPALDQRKIRKSIAIYTIVQSFLC